MEVVKPLGDIIGHAALELQTRIHKIMDKGIFNILVNMKQVNRIDGIAIATLGNLLARGVSIRLFGVGVEVRPLIALSGDEEVMAIIINETSKDAATSVFKRQLPKKQSGQGISARRFPRVDISFPAEFKYHPAGNGVISGRAHIINMSEGGVGMHKIESFEMHTGRQVETPALKNQKLYDMKFCLNGNKKGVETHGECVREMEMNGNRSAGICFQATNREARENIRSYISEAVGSE